MNPVLDLNKSFLVVFIFHQTFVSIIPTFHLVKNYLQP